MESVFFFSLYDLCKCISSTATEHCMYDKFGFFMVANSDSVCVCTFHITQFEIGSSKTKRKKTEVVRENHGLFLPNSLYLSFWFRRLLWKVLRAVTSQNSVLRCLATQRVFLVCDRLGGHFCKECFTIRWRKTGLMMITMMIGSFQSFIPFVTIEI